MSREITRSTVLLSQDGGSVDFIRDGEVLATIAVPAGRVRASQYLDLLPDGAHMQVGKGLVALNPSHRVGIQPYGHGSHDSGANPDFRPTSATRMEREMRLTLNRMKAATSRVEARERALAKIERIPEGPGSAVTFERKAEAEDTGDDPVVE